MKFRFYVLIILLVTSFSCAKYSIKKETQVGRILKGLKSSGIILRNPHDEMIRFHDYNNSLKFWLNGYKSVNNVELLENLDDDLTTAKSTYERFFQKSPDNKFLKFKSIGVISMYIKNNKEKLKKLFTEKNLDSIIVYEVDSAYTIEMQFIDFESVIAIIDKNFNLAYLDHQNNTYDVDETDPEIVKKHLLDNICERLIITLEKQNYLKKSKGIIIASGEKEDKKVEKEVIEEIKIDDDKTLKEKEEDKYEDEKETEPIIDEKKNEKIEDKEEIKEEIKEEEKSPIIKDKTEEKTPSIEENINKKKEEEPKSEVK